MSAKHKKTIDDVVTELVPKEEKATYHANEPIAFKNKVFIYKDGAHCTVIYSDCKDKPIEIKVL